MIKSLRNIIALTLIINCTLGYAAGSGYSGYEGTLQISNSTTYKYCLEFYSVDFPYTSSSYYIPPPEYKEAPVPEGVTATWNFINGGSSTVSGTLSYRIYTNKGLLCKNRGTDVGVCTVGFTVDPYGVTTYDSSKTSCSYPGLSYATTSSNDGKILNFRLSSY